MKSVFRPLEAREIVVPVGMDLGEIHDSEASDIPVSASMRVRVNGMNTFDPTFLPRDGDLVEFISIPQAWLLAFLTTFLPGGAPIIIPTAAQIIQAVVMIAGLLITALFKPQQLQTHEESPTISGSKNSFDPMGPMSRYYGKNRIYPSHATAAYTTISRSEEYLHVLLECGYGPYLIDMSTARVGETPLSDYQDYEYEVRHGFDNDPDITLFPVVVNTEKVGAELLRQYTNNDDLSTGAHARITPLDTTSADLTFAFPNGFDTTYFGDFEVALTIEDQDPDPGDDPIWTYFPDVDPPFLYRGFNIPSTGRRVDWFGLSAIRGWNEWYGTRAGLRIDFNQIENPKYDENDPAATVGQYKITIEVGGNNQNRNEKGVQTGTKVVWQSMQSTQTGDPFRNDIKPHAKVAVRIRASEQLNGVIEKFSVVGESLLPYFDQALDGGNGAWVEVTQPTAYEVVDGITQPVDPTPGQDLWKDFRTHRASWAAADVMRSGNLISREFISDDQIDTERLLELAAHDAGMTGITRDDPDTAILDGYTFHGKIEQATVDLHTVLNNIYATSMAQFVMRDSRYSLIIDQDRSDEVEFPPLGIISPVACEEFSYSADLLYPVKPDAIRFNWRDPTNDFSAYIVGTDTLYRDGYSDDGAGITEVAKDIQDVDTWGITNHDHAIDYVRHKMLTTEWRSMSHTVKVPAEHLSWEIGDLLLLSYDVTGIGEGRGRVVDILDQFGVSVSDPSNDPDTTDIRSIVVDEPVTFTENDSEGVPKLYGIDWSSGVETEGNREVTNQAVTPTDVTTNTIILSADITGSTRPYIGNRFNFGELERVSRRVLVKSKAPDSKFGSELVLHDAADEIFAGITQGRPAYDPAKSIPSQSTPPIPEITGITSELGAIRVVVSPTMGTGIVFTSRMQVRFRGGGDTDSIEEAGPWSSPIEIIPFSGGSSVMLSPVTSGVTYDIQARSLGNQSNNSSWTPYVRYVYEPPSNPRVAITGLEWVGRGPDTEITGNDFESEWRLSIPGIVSDTLSGQSDLDLPFNEDLASSVTGYKVRVKDTVTGRVLREVEVKDRFYNYSYTANLRDGGPYRQITHEVASIQGSVVGYYFPLNGINSPPATPILVAWSESSTSINLQFSGGYQLDPDWDNISVYADNLTTGDVELTDANLVYQGKASTFGFPTTPGRSYRLRWMAADSFSQGPADLNPSPAEGWIITTSAIAVGQNHVADPSFILTQQSAQASLGGAVPDTYSEAAIDAAGYYRIVPGSGSRTHEIVLRTNDVTFFLSHGGEWYIEIETLAADPQQRIYTERFPVTANSRISVRVQHRVDVDKDDEWQFKYNFYDANGDFVRTENTGTRPGITPASGWFVEEDLYTLPSTDRTIASMDVGIQMQSGADGVIHHFDSFDIRTQVETFAMADNSITNVYSTQWGSLATGVDEVIWGGATEGSPGWHSHTHDSHAFDVDIPQIVHSGNFDVGVLFSAWNGQISVINESGIHYGNTDVVVRVDRIRAYFVWEASQTGDPFPLEVYPGHIDEVTGGTAGFVLNDGQNFQAFFSVTHNLGSVIPASSAPAYITFNVNWNNNHATKDGAIRLRLGKDSEDYTHDVLFNKK